MTIAKISLHCIIKLIRARLIIQLFKDTHFVAKDLLNVNNAINTCLINLKIILYHASSLNIYEYLKYHQHQYHHNQLKNYRHPYNPVFFILSYFILSTYLFKCYSKIMELHLFQNPLL